MQYSRNGNYFRGIRITGPRHNLLGLALLEGPGSATPRMVDLAEDRGSTLTSAEVERYVHEGVQEANRAFGTHYAVSAVEFLSTDTPPADVYREIAKCIIERIVRKQPF